MVSPPFSRFVDLSAEDKAEVDDVQAKLHLNLAMCYLKLSAWKKALAECDEALALEPANPKAFYRKATALEQLKV
jgi:Tfp pilus assembly protein PilF